MGEGEEVEDAVGRCDGHNETVVLKGLVELPHGEHDAF